MRLSGIWSLGVALDGDLGVNPSTGAGSPRYFLVVSGRGFPNTGCTLGNLPSPTHLSPDSQCFWVGSEISRAPCKSPQVSSPPPSTLTPHGIVRIYIWGQRRGKYLHCVICYPTKCHLFLLQLGPKTEADKAGYLESCEHHGAQLCIRSTERAQEGRDRG